MAKPVRDPAVAGMFYSSNPQTLRETLAEYLAQATPPALERVRAIIAPHAGYIYSGPVAAFAYKVLAQQSPPPKRIYLMGPAHRVWFSGVALADYEAFKTPLGNYPIDRAKLRQLAEEQTLFSVLNPPHAPEHSLEVQLPFLQMLYAHTPMLPLLFGEVDPIAVGNALNAALEANDLIVVSSDLSHFHTNETAHTRDREFIEAVLQGDADGIAAGEACGQAPTLALHTIAQARGWQPHLLDYRTSGDVSGDTSRVVGYAALAYTEA